MGTASKTDIVRDVATRLGLSINGTKDVIDAFLTEVSDRAGRGETVRLTGFGTFTLRTRAARTGRNPRTGEAVEIAESSSLGFKASKAKGH